jgi:hypothetical protein
MSIRRSSGSRPSSAAGIIVRNDIDLAAIPAADWDALVDGHPLLSHAFLSALHATAARRPPRAGGPVTSRHGATTLGALPSTRRRIRMANTFDWAWADAFGGMAAATIRSSSRRSRSRRHRDRGSSRRTRHAHARSSAS